jgi:hypothetical protein
MCDSPTIKERAEAGPLGSDGRCQASDAWMMR